VIKTLSLVLLAGSVYYYLMYVHHLLFTYKVLILVGFVGSLFLFVLDKKELGFIKKKIGLAG